MNAPLPWHGPIVSLRVMKHFLLLVSHAGSSDLVVNIDSIDSLQIIIN